MAETTDRQKADALRRQKREARADRALNMATTTAEVGGRALQLEGMMAEYGGKVAKPVARGVTKGGEAMVKEGGELSSTGVGAPLGVLVAGAGAIVTGAGYLGQGLAEGAEKQGRAARQTGGRVVKAADDFKKSKHQAGRRQSFGQKLHLRTQRQPRDREDTRSLLGALRQRARENMPTALAKSELALVGVLSAPVRTATSEALSTSWFSIIPSFGLSLIYIHLHVFMRLVAGSDWFCKLGHEWSMSLPGLNTVGDSNKFTKWATKTFGKYSGVVEVIILLIIDLAILLLISAIVMLVSLLVYAFLFPASFIGAAFGLS